MMTNQEARGTLANLEADYRDLDPLVLTNDSIQLVNKRIEALGVAISALRAQDVPDTNVGDMVSRQKTIDAVKRLSLGETDAARLAMRIEDYLKRLPSTLPEPYREDDAK